MIEQKLFEKTYSQIVNSLLFIFPVVIISVKAAGDLVLFILAIMGIFISIKKKLSPFNIKETKVFSYLAIGYFIAVCLSVFFSGKTELVHYIPRDIYFLFAPFILLALYKSEVNINYLLAGIKVGLIVLGVIISNQLLSGVGRPSGVMNADVFANLTASMLFIILVFFQHEPFKYKVFTFVSMLTGFFVIILSGTRGAWLSLILLLGFYFYFLFKQKTSISAQSKIIVVLIIAVVLSIAGLNQSVQDRTLQAYTETSAWLSGQKEPNSVGLRLEMYQAAIENIENVPFFGHGLRTSNIVLYESTPPKFQKYVVSFNHLHNAYLTNYFNGGIVLLAALLLLLFVPFIIFLKANSQNHENPIFIAGALLAVGYSSFGMVNILFGDVFMNAFYVFFMSIFLLQTAKLTKVS